MPMNAPLFLESLSNLPNADYMLSLRERNPSYFLKRAQWLLQEKSEISKFLRKTKIIHITGTSGKGTVGALLQSILAHAGYTVGFYNSPHVGDVYERIRVSKPDIHKNAVSTEIIPPHAFESLAQGLKPELVKSITESPYGLPSYFDILFVLGLLYFKKIRAHWTIIEVGCGGRYDSTNIIKTSDLSLITTIGDDHAHLIGPRLTDIAYEKAGIIKPRGVVVVGPYIKGKALSLIKQEADKKKAVLYQTPMPKKGRPDENFAIASFTAKLLKINNAIIEQGIRQYTPLPGRFEIIAENPTIILDGAHNKDKMRYLIDALEPFFKRTDRKFLIFAATGTKDWRAMLSLLFPCFDKIYLTRHTVRERKVADMKAMYLYVKKCKKLSPLLYLDPEDALKDAMRNARQKDLIVATGSLYLLGSLKKFHEKTPYC